MKSLLPYFILAGLLSGCAIPGIKQDLKPQHADICKRGSENIGTVKLTQSDLRKKFKNFDESVEIEHDYFVCAKDNSKPPLVLLHELPGLETKTLNYALSLAQDFTVYVPLLMGEVYRDNAVAGLWDYYFGNEWKSRTELNGSTLLTQWLRKFIAFTGSQHEQQKIGIIGNCLTGALPLTLLDNQQVERVVLAQPTLPISLLSYLGLGEEVYLETYQEFAISKEEWDVALSRINPKNHAMPSAKAYGTRFERDTIAPLKKHNKLIQELGPGFIDRKIDSREYYLFDRNGKLLFNIPDNAHSSLIRDWEDSCVHPTAIRRKEIKEFFNRR